MTPALRKFNLTAHVTSSVGWLGAVGGFLALSIVGLTSPDGEEVRGAYLAMNLIGQIVIVPLSLAALLTGLVQALGTEWGLFRYYWVFVKFTLGLLATILLMLHQFTAVANAARRVSGTTAGTLPDVGRLGIQLVSDAGLAALLLLVTTTLSVYKPWGRTLYGRRRQQQERLQALGGSPGTAPSSGGLPLGFKLFLGAVGLFVAVVILLHLTGNGLGNHRH